MPNGRRRRFSVKQNMSMNERMQAENSLFRNSNESAPKTCKQSNKTNKLKNNFFATSSKQPPRLDVLLECESSNDAATVVPESSDKEITATSSNIDFYNILNLSNKYNEDIAMDRKVSGKNQISTSDKKDVFRQDKSPCQHRVKVRSPKRRPLNSEEAHIENANKTTKSLDAIDWDQELEETVMLNILENCNDEHMKKCNYTSLKNQHMIMTNIPNQSNPFLQNTPDKQNINCSNTSYTSAESDSTTAHSDESSPVYQGNVSNQTHSTDQIERSNHGSSTDQINTTDHANPTIESNPSNLLSNADRYSHISNISNDFMCRICHGGDSLSDELGRMISACGCRGTVGRVHVRCLERWLTESGKSRCELCGTHYSTKRVHKYGFPKAVAIWVLSHNAKQLMVDSLGIMLMSPLAVVAAWLSGRTLAGLMTPENHQTPWPLASTFVLACMTLVCYYCWIVSAVTRHALGWWIWYRSQYEVHLQLQDNED